MPAADETKGYMVESGLIHSLCYGDGYGYGYG